MLIAIVAVMLHGGAYVLYSWQVLIGESVPNPASWTAWALLASLNAATFYSASTSAISTAQFFAGSVGALVVWGIALADGKFSALGGMEWIVLTACVIACLVWWVTEKAIYGNLILAAIVVVSWWPTFEGVWVNPYVERALPWWMWTVASACTTVNVYRARNDPLRNDGMPWQLLLVTPMILIFIHAVVAVLAVG